MAKKDINYNTGYSLPKEVKELRGTLRPCRESGDSVEVDRTIPEPPDWLDKTAKDAYNDIVKIVSDMGVMSKGDSLALSLLVDAYKRYLDARKDLKKNGQVEESFNSNGAKVRKKNPSIDIAFEAHTKMMNILREFGLTPASRSKVSSVEDEKGDESIKDLLN